MTVLTPYHVNVNCSVLDRSLSVYRDVLGFVPQTRTSPEPQPGAGFGLDVAQWDAWILQGGDEAGVVLDLLEWIEPRPVAAPAARTTAGCSCPTWATLLTISRYRRPSVL